MPERTQLRPHAISCIKDSVFNLLTEHSGDNLTVSCDRDDCWEDAELFKWRQAINVASKNDNVGSPVKRPREKRTLADTAKPENFECYHEAKLNIQVQIFVEECLDEDACMSTKSKAYAILAHVTSCLTAYQDQLLGRRILYTGSTYEQDTTNDLDIVQVTGSFVVHYLFDQTRPWMVGK